MKFTRLALFCSLAAALLVAAQQMTNRLSIEFLTLETEVKSKFGEERASVVNELAETLASLRNESDEKKLIGVNAFFDKHIDYALDAEVFNEKDYWATPSELLGHSRGDCEDFAIAKYVALLHLGVASEKLRLIYVKARIGRSRITQAHMVLGYYDMPSSDPLVLDSLVSNVLPGSQRTDLIPVFKIGRASCRERV